MEMANTAVDGIMSLFKRKNRPNRKKRLPFSVVVEDVTEDKFMTLVRWTKDNIPPIERFTPRWVPDDDTGGFVIPNPNQQGAIQQPPSRSSSATMNKVEFLFRSEENAMAFKLII